jgi:ribosome production factor 2
VREVDVTQKALEMSELGPRFDLSFRRDKLPDADFLKAAMKHPKADPLTPKKKKNLFTNELGEQMGKVYVQQ